MIKHLVKAQIMKFLHFDVVTFIAKCIYISRTADIEMHFIYFELSDFQIFWL